jgi:ribosomal protein S18 acetylase RimI-like enzyme
MRRRLRWRRVRPGELETIASRLAGWDAPAGGAVRHMFPLSTIESLGADSLRIAADDRRWAVAVVFPGRLLIPCGDPEALASAGPPTRRWRLLVGDEAAGDAILATSGTDPSLIVHDQRFLSVDHDRVPGEAEIPDPGLRRAVAEDLSGLAELAVRLHVDDEFGPDPGPAGLRGYRQRLAQTVHQGMVWCVGPVGSPVCKVERSVSSHRWGVQLAGIVVDPAHRGTGVGTAAVTTAVRHALRDGPASRPVSLHVRARNAAALRVYASAGFVDRESWRLAVRG